MNYEGSQKLQKRLNQIKHKLLVMSGKGGVGKSTVAVNLAVSLSLQNKRIGLLDLDIHGPSIPVMLGVENVKARTGDNGMLPVEVEGIKIMSLGFLLQKPDDAIIWRGPLKMKVISQFLEEVEWGELDYLIIDSPPGTGDEPLSICQLIKHLDGAIVVTTPQKVAEIDVRKSISFCNILQIPVIGIIENNSGYLCPGCGRLTKILGSGAGMRISEEMNVPYLGAIPIDPAIAEAGDAGKPYIKYYLNSPSYKTMKDIVDIIK